MDTLKNPTLALLIGTFALSAAALVTFLAGADGLLSRVIICVWLFGGSGAGLTLLMRSRSLPLHVLLGLCIASSWAMLAVLVWLATFWEVPFSLIFGFAWMLSVVLLGLVGWRFLKGKPIGQVVIHRSGWIVLLLLLLLAISATVQEPVGHGADIFPITAKSGADWSTGRISRDDPFTGGLSVANDTFSGVLALAAYASHNHPLEMLSTERILFSVLLALVYAALPWLLGFTPWSSAGLLVFTLTLLPGELTGWMALHYQSWALGLVLSGTLCLISYLADGQKLNLAKGLFLATGGMLLHDFALLFGCLSVGVVVLSMVGFHRERLVWRRGLLASLLALSMLVPVLAARGTQIEATTSMSEINSQRWSKSPGVEVFGHRIRYFPITRVDTSQGIPTVFYFPVFPLLIAGTWPFWDRQRRKALLALLLWPVCILALPPLFHGLSEVVGLPAARRLYNLFPIYEALLFGGAVTRIGAWRQKPAQMLVLGLGLMVVVAVRLPGAAIRILNQLEYRPPEWSDTSVWSWADAYHSIRLKKGDRPSIVVDAPLLMHQGVTSGLTSQRSLLGHSAIQDEETYRRLIAAARILDPFVEADATFRELDKYEVRFLVVNEHYVPRTSRAKFELWSDHFRLVHSSRGCHIYEYRKSGFAESGGPDPIPGRHLGPASEFHNFLSYAPNISQASQDELPAGSKSLHFQNGIVLRAAQIFSEGRVLRLSLWWSRSRDFEPGLEIKDMREAMSVIKGGSSDSYRVCFTLFHADLYGQGTLKAVRRRLLETLGHSPSRLLPSSQMRTFPEYRHPMVWKDWPQTIFECWPPSLWKEGEIWRENYRLPIPKNLVPGRYELRVRQGRYPNSQALGRVIAEIIL